MPEIRKLELMPIEMEISTMEAFVDVLKPIVDITEQIARRRKASDTICHAASYSN